MNPSQATYAPFAKPLYVMLKPIGAICNLHCDYCYYLEKKELYGKEKKFMMSDQLLEQFVEEYIHSQTTNEILFTWHGGEALMRNQQFYEKALHFQQIYGQGRSIQNSLQTNGTLLTDDWCGFFKKHDFLIGISLDGPQHCHDKYRKTKDKRPSFHEVMKGVELLKKHGVEFNIMAVVNDYNVNYPLEFYRFFKSIGAQFIQFSPIVEQIDGHMAPWNVPAGKWGNFLIAIFDEWVRQDVGRVYVQIFDAALANWVGVAPGVCTFAKKCGHAGVIEFNGDVYSCDHFVQPKHKLGNIHTNTLVEMMYSSKQAQFGADKQSKLPKQCKACEYLFACTGECPKNRIIQTKDGEEGLNYLCEGYYRFYKHIAPYMDFMKNELANNRSPAHVMQAVVR